MIQDKDISIVVQGPILRKAAYNITNDSTKIVCRRLRQLFPQSELIISTWQGEDVTGIEFDKVIFNIDPGATCFCYNNYELTNNCNRLIVSTLAGIKAVSRKYVLKLRSDLFVVSKNFLKYFYKFSYTDNNYSFLKNRIIAFSIFSIKAHKTRDFTVQKPYHISDWAYFGYKEDLLKLYDIPLTYEPYFSQWFLNHARPFDDIHPDRLWKMPPEQYITTSFFKKYIKLSFEHRADTKNSNVHLSEQLIANNFLVLDQTQFFLISLKYLNTQLLFEPMLASTAIFYHTWLQDYIKYCAKDSAFAKAKYKIKIFYRCIFYFLVNRLFRKYEKKVSYSISILLKKWCKKYASIIN